MDNLIWRIRYFLEGCYLVYIKRVVTWEELRDDERQDEEVDKLLGFR